MTRLINAAIISIVAFFAILAVFTLAGQQRLNGGREEEVPTQEAMSVTVDAVRWGQAGPEGSVILAEPRLRNPGPGAVVARAVSYEVTVGDRIIDRGSRQPMLPVAAGSDAALPLQIRLPPAFAAQWWPSYLAGQEEVSFRISGLVEAGQGDQERHIPFAWGSTWRGSLLAGLLAGAHDCSDGGHGACLSAVEGAWGDGALHLALVVRNDGGGEWVVRNGTVTVRFSDTPVASGSVQSAAPAPVAPGSEARLEGSVRFDGEALSRWWPGHVARCETTPAFLEVRLTLEAEADRGGGSGAGEGPAGTPEGNDTAPPTEVMDVPWSFPGFTFETAFLCHRAA